MNARLSGAPDARLGLLLQLEQRVRRCADLDELTFLIVNETHGLAPYRQAALWLRGGSGDGRVAAWSGLAQPDQHAPLNAWLTALLARTATANRHVETLTPTAGDQAMWDEHLPAHALRLPLDIDGAAQDAPCGAALVIWRDTPWTGAEEAMLAAFGDAAAHAWRALTPRAAPGVRNRLRDTFRKLHRNWRIALIAIPVLLCIPVRQSVLAPAEIVAKSPAMVRAPLSGVVDEILVKPNQPVHAGDVVARLDARELRARLESSRQALAVASAELRQSQQMAVFDEKSKASLGILNGKREQAENDQDYLESALARTELRAERDGIALFDNTSDLLGKPVTIGERIMMIADPKQVELEVELPVGDAIPLPADAPIKLFLNAAPASPLPATLTYVGYRAAPTPDGGLAYRVRAALDATSNPYARVGQRGSAKLYGERTLLGMYVLRKPLAAMRTWLGW